MIDRNECPEIAAHGSRCECAAVTTTDGGTYRLVILSGPYTVGGGSIARTYVDGYSPSDPFTVVTVEVPRVIRGRSFTPVS